MFWWLRVQLFWPCDPVVLISIQYQLFLWADGLQYNRPIVFFFLFLLPWCVRACLRAAVNLPEAGMWVIVAESVRRIWASKYCTLYFIYCMWESKQKETVLLFKSLWCSQETMMNSPSLNGIPRAVGMEAKIKSWNFFNKASLKGGFCVCVFVSKCYWCYDRAGKMKYQ